MNVWDRRRFLCSFGAVGVMNRRPDGSFTSLVMLRSRVSDRPAVSLQEGLATASHPAGRCS
jgi:hypothetical protein